MSDAVKWVIAGAIVIVSFGIGYWLGYWHGRLVELLKWQHKEAE